MVEIRWLEVRWKGYDLNYQKKKGKNKSFCKKGIILPLKTITKFAKKLRIFDDFCWFRQDLGNKFDTPVQR